MCTVIFVDIKYDLQTKNVLTQNVKSIIKSPKSKKRLFQNVLYDMRDLICKVFLVVDCVKMLYQPKSIYLIKM